MIIATAGNMPCPYMLVSSLALASAPGLPSVEQRDVERWEGILAISGPSSPDQCLHTASVDRESDTPKVDSNPHAVAYTYRPLVVFQVLAAYLPLRGSFRVS